MGLLTGAGCVSRALGPVFVSAVYARRGPDATFGSTAALTFVALAALRLVYARLRPPDPKPPAHELGPLVARADLKPAQELSPLVSNGDVELAEDDKMETRS